MFAIVKRSKEKVKVKFFFFFFSSNGEKKNPEDTNVERRLPNLPPQKKFTRSFINPGVVRSH